MTFQQIIDKTRTRLTATGDAFWSDTDLLDIAVAGARDLWRAICNLNQDYFLTTAPVTLAADGTAITGAPANVSRVLGLKPTLQSSYPSLNFFPRRYTHPDFVGARTSTSQDPASAGPAYYAIYGAGAPPGTPTIEVAPSFSSALALTLIYIPTLGTLALGTENPLPGELDDALVSWTVAHAISDETDNGEPNQTWLAKYTAEKDAALIFLCPRQDDEVQTADALFEGLWE